MWGAADKTSEITGVTSPNILTIKHWAEEYMILTDFQVDVWVQFFQLVGHTVSLDAGQLREEESKWKFPSSIHLQSYWV